MADVDIVNLTMFAIVVLVLFYKNWIPGLAQWVEDRVHGV
jgi:hypothetical protein